MTKTFFKIFLGLKLIVSCIFTYGDWTQTELDQFVRYIETLSPSELYDFLALIHSEERDGSEIPFCISEDLLETASFILRTDIPTRWAFSRLLQAFCFLRCEDPIFHEQLTQFLGHVLIYYKTCILDVEEPSFNPEGSLIEKFLYYFIQFDSENLDQLFMYFLKEEHILSNPDYENILQRLTVLQIEKCNVFKALLACMDIIYFLGGIDQNFFEKLLEHLVQNTKDPAKVEG